VISLSLIGLNNYSEKVYENKSTVLILSNLIPIYITIYSEK